MSTEDGQEKLGLSVREAGQRGGEAVKKKYGPEFFKRIGQKGGAATATFGSIHTVTASFSTTDSLDKVCAFYKSRFPNAMASNADDTHCNFVSNDQKNMITVNAQASGDVTKVQVSNVSKKSN